MNLKVLCKAATKIFVWVRISNAHAAYFQITKSALNEYLESIESFSEDPVFLEIGEEGELYLGRPAE